MKTAIIFATKHGTTAQIAQMLVDQLGSSGQTTLINLCIDTDPSIEEYDRIILGTPVYAGKPLKFMSRFCSKNLAALLSKPLYLFAGGMEVTNERQAEELLSAFAPELHSHASGAWFLGGAFNLEKMSFMERFIVKRISKTTQSVTAIKQRAIRQMADNLNK